MSTPTCTTPRRWPARGILTIGCALVAACSNDASVGYPPAPMPVEPVSSVVVTPDLGVMIVGATAQLAASPRDGGGAELPGRAVAWSTSNAGVAQVSASGVVTGVGEGTVRITATSEGKSGSVSMQLVFLPVVSLAVTPLAATLPQGAALQLTGAPLSNTGALLPGRVVTWSSSAPGTATVSASGLVTGVGTGTATITATCEGRTASAQVTVVAAAGVRVP